MILLYTITGVTGGTATYSYSIDGGALSTTSVTAGLATGIHSVSVQDANGCTFATTFNVGVIAGISSATVNASTASCGTSNATATVSAISKTANDQRDLRIPYSEASIRVLSQNFKRDTVEKI